MLTQVEVCFFPSLLRCIMSSDHISLQNCQCCLSSCFCLNPQGLFSADSQTTCRWEDRDHFLNLVQCPPASGTKRSVRNPLRTRPGPTRGMISAERMEDAQGNSTFLTAAWGGDGGYSWCQRDAPGAWIDVSPGGQRKSTALQEEQVCSSP